MGWYLGIGIIIGIISLFFITDNTRETGRTSGCPPEIMSLFILPIFWGLLIPVLLYDYSERKMEESKYCTNNGKEHDFKWSEEYFYAHDFLDLKHYLSCSNCKFAKELSRNEAMILHRKNHEGVK
jgi:hypothetical protein